jgi:hypothetical protein
MKTLILIAVLLLAAPASAQPTFALWVDQAGTLVNDYDVLFAVNFDVVVTLDSDGHDLSHVTWGMTDLVDAGVFQLNAASPIGSCGLIPENCMDGTYSIAVAGCHPGGTRVQVMRLTYADFSGTFGPDVVAVVGPVDPASTDPGFVDCGQTWFDATMGGSPGGTTSSGVTWPDGGLILNPTRPIPVGESGLSALKARY